MGQIGINLPVPVPPPMFSFTGWKESFAGSIYHSSFMWKKCFTYTAMMYHMKSTAMTSNCFSGDLNVGGTNGLLFFTKTKNILGR